MPVVAILMAPQTMAPAALKAILTSKPMIFRIAIPTIPAIAGGRSGTMLKVLGRRREKGADTAVECFLRTPCAPSGKVFETTHGKADKIKPRAAAATIRPNT